MPLGQSQDIPQTDPGGVATPRFWHRLIRFRHVISGSLALASLNHTCRNLVPTFPQRSPPSLLTTAACGGLRSTPDCRPRRALLHLSYSCAPPCGPAVLVTQDPYRTFDRDSKKAHCDARYLGRLEIIDLESGSAKCIAEHSWLPVAAQPWRRSRPRPAVRTCCLQEIGRHRRTRLSSGSQT